MSLLSRIPFCAVRLLGRGFTLSSDFPRGLSPKEVWKSLLNRILNIALGTLFGEWTRLCQALCKLLLLKSPMREGGRAEDGVRQH